MPTPLFDSLDSVMEKLEAGFEFRAQKVIDRAQATDQRADATFQRLGEYHKTAYDDKIAALNKKLDKLNAMTNGRPIGEGSKGSSADTNVQQPLPPAEVVTVTPTDVGKVETVLPAQEPASVTEATIGQQHTAYLIRNAGQPAAVNAPQRSDAAPQYTGGQRSIM